MNRLVNSVSAFLLLTFAAAGLSHAQAGGEAAPAPLAAGAPTHDHGAAATAAVTIESPWARATAPGATAGGAYATLVNAAAAEIRLLGGSTPMAARVEVHEMTMEGQVMRMRPVEGGLAIPAGGEAALAPGGYHLMLLELNQPLVEGSSFPLTLDFSDGSSVTVSVTVLGLAAQGPAAAAANHQH